MDKTVSEHVIFATIVFIVASIITKDVWAGAALASTIFIVRELTQAEYRWIEKLGDKKRSNLPWYGAFDPRVWDVHSLLDWIVPTSFVFGLAALLVAIRAHSGFPVDLPEFWYRWLA